MVTKGREESDGRIVPQDRRKAAPTSARPGGGKATTASEQTSQLSLLFETADSPKGAAPEAGRSLLRKPVREAVPKSKSASQPDPSAMMMTLEEVAEERNLRRAFEQVESNKGAPGPDRQSVRQVREHLAQVLTELRDSLLDGSYRPGMVRRVWIPKPQGGQRGLGIPNVVDRIVQQAVHQVLCPQYDPTFHESSHGFRPGRSCHTAITEAQKYLREGYDWVVDLDLEKFFDRVPHDRLMARLAQRITDRRLLRLIRQMLEAKVVMPDGVVASTEEGTPQGGPLSPLLSNIVLDELDRELEQRGHRFVRYADDCAPRRRGKGAVMAT
jgi:RNA-directed DNA polymerase